MNPEQFFPKNKLESDPAGDIFTAGEEIKISLESEEEVAYELGGIVKNELFTQWPEPEQQNLINELSALYKNVTFKVVSVNEDGTMDIKPQSPEIAHALLRQDLELRDRALQIKYKRDDGRDLIHDMTDVTLFGVNQDFFSQYEAPVIPHYESLSHDDEVVTALDDPEEFVNQFGNALAFERDELPDGAQELLKQASRALFTKKFRVDFIYDSNGGTENPLVKIYCISILSQDDITNNQLEDIQKVFDEKYGSDRSLLSYLQSTPLKVSASALIADTE